MARPMTYLRKTPTGYGRNARIEGAMSEGERVLLVDDLIATGGTAAAAIRVIERVGGTVEACAFVIELPDLGGRSRVEGNGRRILSICSFEGE